MRKINETTDRFITRCLSNETAGNRRLGGKKNTLFSTEKKYFKKLVAQSWVWVQRVPQKKVKKKQVGD